MSSVPSNLYVTTQDLAAGANVYALSGSLADCAIELPNIDGYCEQDTVTVRLANNGEHRNSARMLVNKMYSWRGYGDDHRIPQSSSHITFTASSGEETIGTITLAVDSIDGLAADETFRDEIDAFRQIPGAKVCELTKLAFDTAVPSKPLLASMFHLVFIYGQRKHSCTDLFIEVNPRHTRFYEVMLGFERVGSLKINTSVSAPSQLMRLQIKTIRTNIDKYAGSDKDGKIRSLYPYFFSPVEEDGIYVRMSK